MFEGQPKGLYALALANTGERFGYYTMLAIFTLFLQAKFGFTAATTSTIFASFLAGVYFMPLIGGILADKFGYEIYEIHNNPRLDTYAKYFAAYVGLPLVRITPTLHQAVRGGKMVLLPNIGEFLSYIKNATYMVTDSFHGTAFAINFNTQFIEVLPNTKTGSRNQSILHLTDLQDRIVTDFNDFSLTNKKIDFERVNNIIATERAKSIHTLKTIIEQ